ncbi:MAG: zinc ribbon domain-containing protein [Rhodospirillales bacterium]
MPDFCTCGAQLPPDARFCHKCGKPQREEDVIVEPEIIAPATALFPAPKPADETPIDFRNTMAVRVGFLTALLASLFNAMLVYACPVWLLAAGFLCVYFYQRRTGQVLTVGNGARMGWITGLFSFMIFTVLFTLSFVAQVRSGELLKNLSEVPFFQGSADQLRELFANPVYLAVNVLVSLAVLFVVFTALSIAGGALGAKMLRRPRNAA